jgi:hypothetical protein
MCRVLFATHDYSNPSDIHIQELEALLVAFLQLSNLLELVLELGISFFS